MEKIKGWQMCAFAKKGAPPPQIQQAMSLTPHHPSESFHRSLLPGAFYGHFNYSDPGYAPTRPGIVIAQHMPQHFTKSFFAIRMNEICALDGERHKKRRLPLSREGAHCPAITT